MTDGNGWLGLGMIAKLIDTRGSKCGGFVSGGVAFPALLYD